MLTLASLFGSFTASFGMATTATMRNNSVASDEKLSTKNGKCTKNNDDGAAAGNANGKNIPARNMRSFLTQVIESSLRENSIQKFTRMAFPAFCNEFRRPFNNKSPPPISAFRA